MNGAIGIRAGVLLRGQWMGERIAGGVLSSEFTCLLRRCRAGGSVSLILVCQPLCCQVRLCGIALHPVGAIGRIP